MELRYAAPSAGLRAACCTPGVCPGSIGTPEGTGTPVVPGSPGGLLTPLPTTAEVDDEVEDEVTEPVVPTVPVVAVLDLVVVLELGELVLVEEVVLDEVVEEVVLDDVVEVRVVVDVLPASGRGMLTEGGGGTFVGRRVFGGSLITGGPAHDPLVTGFVAGGFVAVGFTKTVVVTVTVLMTVTCWRFSTCPCGRANAPTASAEVRRVEERMMG